MSKTNWFIITISILFLCLLTTTTTLADTGHNIKVTIKGVTNTDVYLGYHYGKKVYVEDTAATNKKGTVIFKGKETLPGGIYIIIVPKKGHFEFLLDDKKQQFSLTTDTLDYVQHMKVSGSKDNILFNDYQKFLGKTQKEVANLKKQLDNTEVEDSMALLQTAIDELQQSVSKQQQQIIEKEPNSFFTKILTTTKEPIIPDTLQGKPLVDTDRFFYLKNHFFDKVDFSDNRLVRTPVIYNRINHYLEKLTPKFPDSINVAADIILDKAMADKDMFRYALTHITHTYETSKIMGMDAVFVHLARKYYLTGKADWMDSTRLSRVAERVERLKHSLIGNTAPPITLYTIEGEKVPLYKLDSDYTVMHFWDYKCGHCKKTMPKYVEVFEKYKDKGVKFYSVCTRIEKDKWQAAIDKYKLNWINVYDPYNRSNFRALYDIHSTPTVFILDKNKKIVAKKIGAEQVDKILDNLLKL